MTSLSKFLTDKFVAYKNWVRSNPESVSQFESWFIIFELLQERFMRSRSMLLTEILQFFRQILKLIHEQIKHSSSIPFSTALYRVKIFLTVLYYAEIMIEISAQSLFGERGRWLLILLVQFTKFFTKLILLFYYKERVVAIPYSVYHELADNSENVKVIVLKRTGRVMRTIESAPPRHKRSWTPPVYHKIELGERTMHQMIGEFLYIMKPMINMRNLATYGYGTWKPFTVSLALDLISLYLVNYHKRKSPNALSQVEANEYFRRRRALLIYFLMTPLYERYTKNKLKKLFKKIPLIGRALQITLNYYLSTYSFVWSS